MSPTLHHECTRLPVTALSSCGTLLVAAEGPFLRFYHAKNSRYIASKRVFKAQAVHGISVYSESYDDVIKLVIWGGRLIRALEVSFASGDYDKIHPNVCLSEVAKASDWILDLAPRFSSLEDEADGQHGICVAVTAHNALVQVTIQRKTIGSNVESMFALSILELTSSSRSILYSAHVFWESENCVLVAAGTAFGEIMYWSWNSDADIGAISRVHRVFLGHEGSIFGVRISKELPSDCCQSLKRVIASCSDDRTIRIWDVSDVAVRALPSMASDHTTDSERTRHTGFSNAAVDQNMFSSSQCLAIGWGHASRIWNVQFLDSAPCEGALFLVSAGEDATSRTWKLSLDKREEAALPYQLLQQDCAAYHSGKNIWSSSIYSEPSGREQILCGAADAKITSSPLVRGSGRAQKSRVQEYTVLDVLSLAHMLDQQTGSETLQHAHKSSKKAEFFRSYCFIDHTSFLLTTNSGNVLVASLQPDSTPKERNCLKDATFVDQPPDLKGYSVCASDISSGVAFIAGSMGTIYMFSNSSKRLTRVGSVEGKVGEMLAESVPRSDGYKEVVLLVTLVGQKEAQLLYVDIASDSAPRLTRTIVVPISELLTGAIITAMSLTTTVGMSFLHLGFRRGSIAVYSISNDLSHCAERAALFRVVEKVHGDETVTALQWEPSSTDGLTGYLTSVGRNGCLAIHHTDLRTNCVELVHNLPLPVGPNIEGLFFHKGQLLVHGFSSKKWVLYNVTNEEEVMSVETGGAHRSWAFHTGQEHDIGGTLVWTRASSMHICSQAGPNHGVVRPGGHGREIKAVAVSQSPSGPLVATGAEDTDIKLFEYAEGELLCRRTLRRHTTGIQHLQWSEDGEYLFSSGGCEEFYIWKTRRLPSAMGVGIVCDFTYVPESEHSDLRIMSFDVTQRNTEYDIALVFSDSSIKVYRFAPTAAVKWQPLVKGLYFTSCLTQCLFLTGESILTAGTDGHAVAWSLSSDITQRTMGSTTPTSTLEWEEPIRIHQSASKTTASCCLDAATKLVVSGGDDGSLAILLTRRTLSISSSMYAAAPLLLSRTHASAVTSCAILMHTDRIFILSSGNDQWIRLWEVYIHARDGTDTTPPEKSRFGKCVLDIRQMGKIKTNVADVSGMAVLDAEEKGMHARVLVCGVGMEVVRLEWDKEDAIVAPETAMSCT